MKGLIERYKIGNNEEIAYIIQVGDFGIGFYPKTDNDVLLHLNKFFKLRNIIMIVIRGNHDNPEFFKGNHIYSNLKLVEDYTVIDIYDEKYLFVGGAISIDRKPRLKEMQQAAIYGTKLEKYWFDEEFVLDERKLKDITGIDVVVTHSAPSYCYPDNKKNMGALVNSYAEDDENLIADLKREREDITEMFEILRKNGNNISKHYYGHFHSSNITMNGYTNHYLVNINEFVE
jgi:DNA repair exonuclease SbcCD nuclease subunit